MVLDALSVNQEEIGKIKGYYSRLRQTGELDKILTRLMRKQKRAMTTNGPHPHH